MTVIMTSDSQLVCTLPHLRRSGSRYVLLGRRRRALTTSKLVSVWMPSPACLGYRWLSPTSPTLPATLIASRLAKLSAFATAPVP